MATATVMRNGKATEVAPVSNGAEETLQFSEPYVARVRIQGTADVLFHRWNCEAVDAKSKAAKGSKAKKSDDIESYVYRDDDGHICMPGEYLRGAIITAAKFRQDPRSPRKSAMDLYKAAVITLSPLAKMLVNGKPVEQWQYEHKCRVQIQRNSITRTRPALKAGWSCEFEFSVMLPEYVPPSDLNEVIANAGRLIGVADFRPTYGRFQVTKYEVA